MVSTREDHFALLMTTLTARPWLLWVNYGLKTLDRTYTLRLRNSKSKFALACANGIAHS